MPENERYNDNFFQCRKRLTKLETFNVKDRKEIQNLNKIVLTVNIQLPSEFIKNGNQWLPNTSQVFQNWCNSLLRGKYRKDLKDIKLLYKTSKELVEYTHPEPKLPLANYYNALKWISTGRLFLALRIYYKNHVKAPHESYNFCFSELLQTVSEYTQLWWQTHNSWYKFSDNDKRLEYYLNLQSIKTIMEVIEEYDKDAYKIFQGGVSRDLDIKNIIKKENEKDRAREQSITRNKQQNNAVYAKDQEYYQEVVTMINLILKEKKLLLPDDLKNNYNPPLDENLFDSWYSGLEIEGTASSANDVLSIYNKTVDLLKMPYRKKDIYGQVNNYYNAIVFITSTNFLYQIRDLTERYGTLTNDRKLGLDFSNYSDYQLRKLDEEVLQGLIDNHTNAMNHQDRKHFSDREFLDDINKYMTGEYITDKIKFIKSNLGNINKVITSN